MPRLARSWLLAAALLATAGGGAAGCDSGGGERVAVPQPPRTGFERSGGDAWTSLADERAFLRRLDESERVRVVGLGRSLQGRPLRLVLVGPSRTPAQVAAESSALLVCGQHGDEPAGREACLERVREHARGRGDRTLLVMPTTNPDGTAAGERENAAGADVNRDHLRLATPEARAIATVLRDFRPDVLVDPHEYSRPGADAVLFHDRGGEHPATDAELTRLSELLKVAHLAPAVERAGFATGIYETPRSTGTLRVVAGLKHVVTSIVETPRRGPLSPQRRVAAQRAALDGALEMLRGRADDLERATATAGRRALDGRVAAEGSAAGASGPICAYALEPEQHAEVGDVLALHGVRTGPAGDAWVVPVAQPARHLVALLLDPRAPAEITAGRPLAC